MPEAAPEPPTEPRSTVALIEATRLLEAAGYKVEPLSPNPEAFGLPGRIKSNSFVEGGGVAPRPVSDEMLMAEARRLGLNASQLPAHELNELRKKLAGEPYEKKLRRSLRGQREHDDCSSRQLWKAVIPMTGYPPKKAR